MINISVVIMLCFYLKDDLKNPKTLKIKSILCFLILLVGFIFSDHLLKFTERQLYSNQVVYKHSTQYQRIVLTEDKGNYQLFLNNNLQFNTKDEYRYHEVLVHPAMSIAKKPKHILVLGGGDGLAAREILKYPTV